MTERIVHWSVTTSSLIGAHVAAFPLWVASLLVVGIVAVQVSAFLWVGGVLLLMMVWKLFALARLRRVAKGLKAVRLKAAEFVISGMPFEFQIELDSFESLGIDRVDLINKLPIRGWDLTVRRLALRVKPDQVIERAVVFDVSGIAPVLTRLVKSGVANWSIRVKVQGADFSFPFQLQDRYIEPPNCLMGSSK